MIIMRKFWRDSDTVHSSKHNWCVVIYMYLIYYSVKRADYYLILYFFHYVFVCSYKWCTKSTENTNLNTGIIKIIHTSTVVVYKWMCIYISIYIYQQLFKIKFHQNDMKCLYKFWILAPNAQLSHYIPVYIFIVLWKFTMSILNLWHVWM